MKPVASELFLCCYGYRGWHNWGRFQLTIACHFYGKKIKVLISAYWSAALNLVPSLCCSSLRVAWQLTARSTRKLLLLQSHLPDWRPTQTMGHHWKSISTSNDFGSKLPVVHGPPGKVVKKMTAEFRNRDGNRKLNGLHPESDQQLWCWDCSCWFGEGEVAIRSSSVMKRSNWIITLFHDITVSELWEFAFENVKSLNFEESEIISCFFRTQTLAINWRWSSAFWTTSCSTPRSKNDWVWTCLTR